jgi:hypothetical protein
MFAATKPPKPAHIGTVKSTIGTNNTLETVQAAPKTPAASTAVDSGATGSTAAPATTGGTSQPIGGIVPSTGLTPAATLANETASNMRNQVVGVSGGGK